MTDGTRPPGGRKRAKKLTPQQQAEQFPELPGVLVLKNRKGKALYVRHAGCLRKQARSLFTEDAQESPLIRKLIFQTEIIEPLATDCEIDAMLLADRLCKHLRPRFNLQFAEIPLSSEEAETNAGINTPQERQEPAEPLTPREQTAQFPASPGIYLMKDQHGVVIYIGKAVNLKSRASSYFTEAGRKDRRVRDWIERVTEVGFVSTDTEIDAILMEARLIKDIQPEFNVALKDGRSFPYLQITTGEDFPRIEFTRAPESKNVKLYGPFPSPGKLRGTISLLQKVFKFRTCTLDIDADDERWKWFRPCLLHSIKQCSAPCNQRISKEEYRKDIQRLKLFLDGQKNTLLDELRAEMLAASQELKFEKAARIRDQIRAMEKLNERGDVAEHAQPEVFFTDPKKGLAGLKKIFKLKETPRCVEGIDIAHLQGGSTVASLVQFLDGFPFKSGYRRYRIDTVDGVDDYASIREVVSRRLRRLSQDGSVFPDVLLIDGGKGQLNAALEAMRAIGVEPPFTISLAKQEEEIYVPGEDEPRKLSRHSHALKLLQYVRDEAHRFAQHYHKILRSKKIMQE